MANNGYITATTVCEMLHKLAEQYAGRPIVIILDNAHYEGVGMILTLRTLNLSEGAWDSFWSKISRYGIPHAKQFGQLTETTAMKQ